MAEMTMIIVIRDIGIIFMRNMGLGRPAGQKIKHMCLNNIFLVYL